MSIHGITLYNFFDIKVFKNWKYRDTNITTEEYLEYIGVTKKILKGDESISKEIFLFYIEFTLNMLNLLGYEINIYNTDPILSAAIENISIILEKMNYIQMEIDDKIIITKRDSDVDSILDKVDKSIAECLLEYNDFRNKDDIEEKRKILKTLDLFIEQEKTQLKQNLDNGILDSIGTIVNEMGVNHPRKNEPYRSFNNSELLVWYDKCFTLMIHAIRSLEVSKIKNERSKLVQK